MAVYTAAAFGRMTLAGNNVIAGSVLPRAMGRFTGLGGVVFSGSGVVSGLAEVRLSNGSLSVVPGCRVVLLDRLLGQKLSETRSAADGSYAFVGLNGQRRYVVLAFDPSGTYNAVVKDAVVPV